ncbi:YneF family protein [Salinicoccus luteus]|uniref:YneF family protein n=1 Tax=Salinicoccus luteus TaxID=367840 RepID=UPI0004E1C902|nr:YneF family protein [Salinicoccus luteus]
MATWIWILIVIIALIGGVALGFFLARKYMMDYLEKNPPINEDMLRMMMMQMGQKPSQKKINQMMTMMNRNTDSKSAKERMKAPKASKK